MSKLWLMILSFLLSLVLWVYVQVQEYPTKPAPTNYLVEVSLRNLPDNLTSTKPEPIRFFPRGLQEDLAQIDPKQLSAYVDLSEPRVGTYSYPVKLQVRGTNNVRWEPAAPQVTLTIRQKKTRAIPVRVQVVGELPNPDYLYLPISTVKEPANILVTGPDLDVDRVAYARAILDLSRVSPGGEYESRVELLQENDAPVSAMVSSETKTVIIRPAIAVGLDVKRLPVHATTQGSPAPGFRVREIQLRPTEVQVRGRLNTLEKMSHVNTSPIDISGWRETRTVALNPLIEYEDVALPSQQSLTATVIIEPVAAVPPAGERPRRRAGG